MERFLEACESAPWREVLPTYAPESLLEYITSPRRAAFQDVIPVQDGARILDIGAGLGAIAAGLADRHHVVALEGVWERTRFLAVRKRQDALSNLTVLNGDLAKSRLAPGQFDVIVVNGVLEWVGLFDLTTSPEEAQRRFLSSLCELLRPGGFIYVGIENRFGWAQFRGALDHSGIRYTSLMPRWMARWVCSSVARYRSTHNSGYRTLTYSFSGYDKLFKSAGMSMHSAWIAVHGYNMPDELVPLCERAIRDFCKRRLIVEPISIRAHIRNLRTNLTAFTWFWRWFGSDYSFLVQKPHA